MRRIPSSRLGLCGTVCVCSWSRPPPTLALLHRSLFAPSLQALASGCISFHPPLKPLWPVASSVAPSTSLAAPLPPTPDTVRRHEASFFLAAAAATTKTPIRDHRLQRVDGPVPLAASHTLLPAPDPPWRADTPFPCAQELRASQKP